MPRSVRQLQFACDEQRSRIFDQGLPDFVLGVHDADVGFVSVLLPPDAEALQEQAALNDHLALQLLGNTYSANAHAFGLAYQNCNQWLAELLATAWGGLTGSTYDVEPDGLSGTTPPRAKEQTWLRQHGYHHATLLDMGWRPLRWLATFSPWLHTDDHTEEELATARLRVSMPEGLKRFVHDRWPAAQRLEFCYTAEHVVRRHGWAHCPMTANLQPMPVGHLSLWLLLRPYEVSSCGIFDPGVLKEAHHPLG